MTLLEQLISYLSQPPDSIVYHIVMLLALQATLGLAWWQARRNPSDGFARRLAWASGLILLSRLLILLALFAASGNREQLAVVPPLERAADTLAVALLVWALAPQPKKLPLLSTALLLIVILIVAVFYVASANEWNAIVEGNVAEAGYLATQQATVWSIIQMTILAIGGALVLYARERQWSLRLALLIILFAAQLISLLFGRAFGPPNAEIAFWTRLGNIVAYPLLAILTYRHNLSNLLPFGQPGHAAASQIVRSFELSDGVVSSLQPSETLENALKLVSSYLPSQLVAIAQIDPDRRQQLQVILTLRDHSDSSLEVKSAPITRLLRRDDWSGLAQALNDDRQILLAVNGSGSRHLHDLCQKLAVDRIELMLVQPMVSNGTEIGLVLLGRVSEAESWSDEEKELVQVIGAFVGHSLYNAQRYQLALAGRAPDIEREMDDLRAKLAQMTGQRDELQEQVTQVSDQLAIVRDRLDADHRKLRETTQALALAAQRQTIVHRLELEINTLREALSEAEMALAYAAAAEAGLSTEWVMRTVTRYSGELEEAQAQIGALQDELRQQMRNSKMEDVADIARKLRTPLTAIGGYTDLLLDQEAGEISSQQESLLRRVRVNVDNMARTVESLSVSTRTMPTGSVGEIWFDIQEALEEAVYSVSDELQAKKLRVDIFIEDNLPAVPDPGDGLHELLTDLLSAACLVSKPEGRINASARQLPCDASKKDGKSSQTSYLHLSFNDNSGSHSHSLFEEAVSGSGAPRKDGSLADPTELAELLNSASEIASTRSGKIWLDLNSSRGSTLALLLPTAMAVPEESS